MSLLGSLLQGGFYIKSRSVVDVSRVPPYGRWPAKLFGYAHTL